MDRKDLVEYLKNKIIAIKKDSPVLIGINGVDASGKTFFAKSLVKELEKCDKKIIYATIDDFGNPKKKRYIEGRLSPEGYYNDSFDYKSLKNIFLDPLSKSENLKYRTGVFDFFTDTEIRVPEKVARKDSVIILEGIFLFRPELVKYFDYKIFLDVDFDIVLDRAIKRVQDIEYLGSMEEVIKSYKQRYIPAQKLYFKDVKPKEKSDIVINNNDFKNPIIKSKVL